MVFLSGVTHPRRSSTLWTGQDSRNKCAIAPIVMRISAASRPGEGVLWRRSDENPCYEFPFKSLLHRKSASFVRSWHLPPTRPRAAFCCFFAR